MPLSIYDLNYDVEDAIEAFKKKSGRIKALTHLALDYPFQLSKFTNAPIIGAFDDWIPIAGLIDDLIYGRTGKNVEDLKILKHEKANK